MLIYFVVLLTAALLNFGAVLPHAWLLVAIFWLIGFAAVLLARLLKGLSVTRELVGFALGAAFLFFAGEKAGAAALAGCWVWADIKREPNKGLKLFNFLILIGVLEALLGLVQFFVSPGWIFGYIGPNRVSGTLINRNHFAGLLGLLVPLCFGYAYIGMRRFGDVARSYVYVFLGAFMATALIFSLSRSGVLSFLVTLVAVAVLVTVKDARARVATGLGLGMLGLVIMGALWIGIDVVIERYADFLKEESLVEEGRLLVYRDTARLIQDYPLGVGVGNYSSVFRQYQTFRTDLLFDHAHNDYLEITAELGLPVAILFWGFVMTSLFRMGRAFLAARSPERSGILLGCTGAVFTIVVHSLTDFNLQIPSNAMLFAALLGTGIANCEASRRALD